MPIIIICTSIFIHEFNTQYVTQEKGETFKMVSESIAQMILRYKVTSKPLILQRAIEYSNALVESTYYTQTYIKN